MITVRVPKSLWMSSNRPIRDYGHTQRIRDDLHRLAWIAARGHAPIVGQVRAVWTVHYPKGTRTDKGEASNAQPTTKALLDGLVPMWLPDDGPKYVLSETFQRGPNLTESGVHVVALELVPA